MAVTEGRTMTFGELLKGLRSEAGLTQEELAEAAGVSVRSISDLERGVYLTARKQTASRLADGLALAGTARVRFEAAARGHPLAGGITLSGLSAASAVAATMTLPRDIASFTGRAEELLRLTDTAGQGGVMAVQAIDGMAGVGKTTFAVHAAHRLSALFPDGQIFLPLHAHTPGRQPADAENALASLLLTIGVARHRIPPGLEPRTGLWRAHLAGRRLLLLFDDASGHEQVRPLLPGTAGHLVLITSRRRLTALEDCEAISLDILGEREATELFVRLAGRPELRASDAAVGGLARLSGYLPLALGLLARQLYHHEAWTAAELAADLADARNRLELMHAENLSVAAAFDLSCQDLSSEQRRFFRLLARHPGVDFDDYAAAALTGSGLGTARRLLADLYDQHLITEPAHGRYRFHDLIREHARSLELDQAGAAEGEAAVAGLLDFYLHTARSANRHFARWTASWAPEIGTLPGCAPDLIERSDAAAWMSQERLNLHAAIEYAAAHGRSEHVVAISSVIHGFFYVHGHWDEAAALHRVAVAAARKLGDPVAEADALTDLGDIQHVTTDLPAATISLTRAIGMYRAAADPLGEANALVVLGIVQRFADYYLARTSFTRSLALYQEIGDLRGEATVLYELGLAQPVTDGCAVAAVTLARAIELHRELGNRPGEAKALNFLGMVHYLIGDYPAATADLTTALVIHRERADRLGEATALNYLGVTRYLTGDHQEATAILAKALEIYSALNERLGEANTLNYLAILSRLAGDYQDAALGHAHALKLYRDIGNPLGEAYALHYLGVLQTQTGEHQTATENLAQALSLFERVGDRFGAADVLNSMGDFALAQARPAEALPHYQRALALAAEIGSPLREATAREGVGRCDLAAGRLPEARSMLSSALTIFDRIGSPHAGRVAATLRDNNW